MLFRQALTSLARGGDGPSTLAALDPQALAEAVRTALVHGLFDDLEWLAPQAAGLALYELASALPQGHEQRELGRRLLGRLYAANANTFAIVAARMASGSIRGLLSPAVRARVALLVELPLSEGIPDGPLALAILSRRELARSWIEMGSTSSLPNRRLAARLLERAAREATFRAAQGEDHALRPFSQENILQSLVRLLADREP
ncbi:MAG: serine/threonine protein kinase, partial [Proteobacteria bacterium]